MRKGTDVMQSVLINSASEDDSNAPPVKTSNTTRHSKPAQKSNTAFGAKPRSKPESEQKSTITEVKPKSKPRSATETAAETAGVAATADVNTLPEFARSTWGTTFLPTLYDRLGFASDPFLIDVDMVKVIQEVVDLAYPDSDYQVRLGDRIFGQVSLLYSTMSSD
jgi:hypothetical protein